MKKQALATRGLFISLIMSISKTATVTLPRTSSTALFERLQSGAVQKMIQGVRVNTSKGECADP